MALNNNQQLARILISIAKNPKATVAEQLEATKQLLDLQARKPNPKAKSKKAVSSPLG